jgi:hypothetical protein
MPTYFITFTAYGQRLHGDARGSADRHHNQAGAPLLAPDPERVARSRQLMTDPPYRMDERRRGVVLSAILEHAGFRGWSVLACRVRTTHVHVVVAGDAASERMMTAFKAYASRALSAAQLGGEGVKRWSRRGSTRHLNTEESVRRAVRYAVDEQGEPMAVYEATME